MFKRTLGILISATLLALGCGDNQSPTEPRLQITPRPPASLLPVVVSAEPINDPKYYFSEWMIRGLRLSSNPKVTFEAGGSVIIMNNEDTTSAGNYVGASLPPGAAPGAYTPCVETEHGKGCGTFLVTLD